MASPNARAALMAYPTYRMLRSHHKDAWLEHLETLGAMADPLVDGEVFESVDHCRARLDAFGFREGCRFVVGRNRAHDKTPTWVFRCQYWGESTMNTWNLEDRVARDDKGKVISKR